MTKKNTEVVSAKDSFIRAEEGNGFVEKIIIIALFAFVVSAGIKLVAKGSNDKLQEQSESISGIRGTVQ
ncbi:MAG: hypothetical protein GY811_15510 [Myxococcales bacterium]|nr:hypothetical protein [Myxococcales bacterium]